MKQSLFSFFAGLLVAATVALSFPTTASADWTYASFTLPYTVTVPPATPVDGVWGPWGPWSACSVTACGQTGTQSRTRTCTPPQNGGVDCVGSPIEYQACSTEACPVVDVCPNISGVQETVPVGYSVNGNGQCVPPNGELCPDTTPMPTNRICPNTIQYCPNAVPMPLSGICPDCTDASCTTITKKCLNGTVPVNNTCRSPGGTSIITDTCWNIIGVQLAAPAGYMVDDNGMCVPIGYPESQTDWCPNIFGIQTVIPNTMTVNAQGFCGQIKKPFFVEF